MSTGIISVEQVGKRYRLRHFSSAGYTTLRETLAAKAGRLLRMGLKQPEEKVGEDFWALKDVSFEITRGDIVGIIGRNGAGKSTLLKILSRITEPTKGRIRLRGRVASLLEVGTGFHPELTGRENIYLNGAILGMSKREITAKFDEIVAFAEVAKFLDTPVKHYSSGMYVRLAFAVAAHLEPEILVIDEVLAVGDAEFQKKCLGKMQDVAGHGRTVLFVSHNMAAVQSLCETGIYLQAGSVAASGPIKQVILNYSLTNSFTTNNIAALPSIGRKSVRFDRVEFISDDGQVVACPTTAQPITVRISLTGDDDKPRNSRIGVGFTTLTDKELFLCANEASHPNPIRTSAKTVLLCRIERFPLTGGRYGLNLFLERDGVVDHWLQQPYPIDVEDGSFYGTPRNTPIGLEGQSVLVRNTWAIQS